MLGEDRVLEVYNKGIKCGICKDNNPDAQFTLLDLVGEKIINARHIFRGRNGNPDFLNVLDFESGRVLITGVEGWQDGTTHHQYLVEREGAVKYTHYLFEPNLGEASEIINKKS